MPVASGRRHAGGQLKAFPPAASRRLTSSGGWLASGRIMGKDGRAWTSVAVSGLVLMALQGNGRAPARSCGERRGRRAAAAAACQLPCPTLAQDHQSRLSPYTTPRRSTAAAGDGQRARRAGARLPAPPCCNPRPYQRVSSTARPRDVHLVAPSTAHRLGFAPRRRRQAPRAAESRLMAAGSGCRGDI